MAVRSTVCSNCPHVAARSLKAASTDYNITLPEEKSSAGSTEALFRSSSVSVPQSPERALLRRLEAPFLECLQDASVCSRRSVFVVIGPRKSGMHTFFEQVVPDAPCVNFADEGARMDAEDAPRTFFARYAALPMLVLYNVHLVPALARLIVSEAGRMHEGADLAAPKIVIMGSSVRLPELETAAERNSNVRIFRMRTLSQGEITGGGHDFLERLRLLDFPSVVSYNESNRDLILSQAMRGGYPSGRDGTPDERHDFFHDLIREICRLDLPSVSPLKNPLLLRKVYRMVGAVSGESVNLTHIAEVLGIGRPFAKHCLETLERLCLVDRIAVWPGSLAFERGVRSPKYVVADSGWLCGLLGFCSTTPCVISSDHPEDVRRLLTTWTWAQLATLTDNARDLHLWHFALRTGLSIDLILEDARTGSLTAFQVSTRENVTENDFGALVKFRELVKDREVQNVLLYCGQSLRRFDSIGVAVPMAFLWL